MGKTVQPLDVAVKFSETLNETLTETFKSKLNEGSTFVRPRFGRLPLSEMEKKGAIKDSSKKVCETSKATANESVTRSA